MKVETFQYFLDDQSWSISALPELDSKQTLVIIFAAPEFNNQNEPFATLKKQYPNSYIIGCSTAGEVANQYVYDNSLSVAVIQFEHTQLQVELEQLDGPEQSFDVGQKLVKKFNKPNLNGLFLLSEGLNINGSELVKGLNSSAASPLTITGGLAADGSRFEKTWIIYNSKLIKNHVVAVGFYGTKLILGHGSRGGWDIFGPERQITRSKDNILYELDNKPALALYKEYLGNKAEGLPSTGLLFPLAIRESAQAQKRIVRTILGIDESQQSLIFAGDMPVGYTAQLMRGNFDRIIDGAYQANRLTLSDIQQQFNEPQSGLLIAISCVGRRLLLGERIEEETEVSLDGFPSHTKQVGYYSYGEISPYTKGSCDLHNQTMTLTYISEINSD